jgi:hypothetical protein
MPPPDVVEVAIVGLRHQGVDRPDRFITGQVQHVVDQRIRHPGNAEGGSEQYRGFGLSQLVHLRRAHQLAETVADEDCSRHLVLEQVASVRQDSGDAGADLLVADQGDVPHGDTRDISDCVQGAGR